MGIAELIPGLGATTVALITGIFSKILDIINDCVNLLRTFALFVVRKRTFNQVKTDFKEIDFIWTIKLLLGALIGVGVFVNIISYLLHNYENGVYAFILGPIIFSIYILYSQIKKFKLIDVLFIAIGFVITYVLLDVVGYSRTVADPSMLLVYAGGIVAALAVLLPGISVPFVLILLGIYDPVINSVKRVLSTSIDKESLVTLIIFVVGVVSGVILLSKIFRYLLQKYESYTLSIIIGIMMASIKVVNPFTHSTEVGRDLYILIGLMFVGIFVVFVPYYILKTKEAKS